MPPVEVQPVLQPAPALGRSAVDQQQQGARRSCLLVDDSRMIRKVARQIIEEIGYSVSEAENGEEALAKCAIAMPDLILLDWDMPVMTGIDFLAALRERQGAKSPKVVFCTTKSGAREIHQGIDVGADEYLTKPFDRTSLMKRLVAIGAA